MKKPRCILGGVLQCKKKADFEVRVGNEVFRVCEEHKNHLLYEQSLVKEPSLRVTRL